MLIVVTIAKLLAITKSFKVTYKINSAMTVPEKYKVIYLKK